jgi:hypothetical protein
VIRSVFLFALLAVHTCPTRTLRRYDRVQGVGEVVRCVLPLVVGPDSDAMAMLTALAPRLVAGAGKADAGFGEGGGDLADALCEVLSFEPF